MAGSHEDADEVARGFGSDPPQGAPDPHRKFLSIWFRCCHTYGRLYRNAEETAYLGRCPSCGAPVQALIGPHGTDKRMFMTDYE